MTTKLRKFIHSDYGRLIIAFILGFGLSTLFRKSCGDKSCLQFKGPKAEDIKGETYEYGEHCYTFKPNPVKCSSTKKIIRFA